jgi:dihydrofolate synthase/folylpolyglutamate synthase
VPARKLDVDEPFFREWRNRRAGDKRSLVRAGQLMDLLGLQRLSLPVLTVVGSKGKATTAIYAAATLAAQGLKVGLQTSPPILENRERVRVNGVAIDDSTYASLAHRLESLLDRLPSGGDGYLSPTGLFTLMGVRHMLDQRCDVLVLEAGLGGRSDEVSLFSAAVVAITRIFGEHADIIGPTVEDVAEDKVGVVDPSTSAVFSIPQLGSVREIVAARVRSTQSDLVWVNESAADNDTARNSETPNARGLSIQNARLGISAALRLSKILGLEPNDEGLKRVLPTVWTPGRLSTHIDQLGRLWVVDACIDERGAATALRYCETQYGPPTTIFVSIPDSKDVAGVRRALSNYPFVPVGLTEEHLSFSGDVWDTTLVDSQNLEMHIRGDRILAMGTWSFISVVLDHLHVEADVAFHP